MRKLLMWLVVTMYLAAPVAALAQNATPEAATVVEASATPTPIPEGDLEGAVDMLPKLVEALWEKNWPMVASLVLMLLVFGVRTYLWKSIPKRSLPLATAALAMAGSVSVGLLTDAALKTILVAGLGVGVAAGGSYDLIKSGVWAVKALIAKIKGAKADK